MNGRPNHLKYDFGVPQNSNIIGWKFVVKMYTLDTSECVDTFYSVTGSGEILLPKINESFRFTGEANNINEKRLIVSFNCGSRLLNTGMFSAYI